LAAAHLPPVLMPDVLHWLGIQHLQGSNPPDEMLATVKGRGLDK